MAALVVVVVVVAVNVSSSVCPDGEDICESTTAALSLSSLVLLLLLLQPYGKTVPLSAGGGGTLTFVTEEMGHDDGEEMEATGSSCGVVVRLVLTNRDHALWSSAVIVELCRVEWRRR